MTRDKPPPTAGTNRAPKAPAAATPVIVMAKPATPAEFVPPDWTPVAVPTTKVSMPRIPVVKSAAAQRGEPSAIPPRRGAGHASRMKALKLPRLLMPTSMPSVVLPGIPSDFASQTAALVQQFGITERLPTAQLRALQMLQLAALLEHAWAHAPLWHARLADAGWRPSQPVDLELLRRLPILTRAEIQEHGAALRTKQVPQGFGSEHHFRTSGSTGRPVEVYRNELNQEIYGAQTFRDHLWHGRDTTGKLAVLRTHRADKTLPDWGQVLRELTIDGSGPAVIRGSDGKEFRSHLDWLVAERPDYLNINPSLALALARLHLREGYPRLAMHQILSVGGTVTDEARALCRDAWGAEFTDRYSCEEIGYLAFQCPLHTHYHEAETVILEIVDAAGRPCAAGQTGRVVVTALLSFAMPLIRYDLGDMAVPGDACDCGRGLPVVARVMGRQSNFAVLPTGSWRAGLLQAKDWTDVAPVLGFRVTQTALDTLEAELVLARPLSEPDVAKTTAMLRAFFSYDFAIIVKQVEEIAWGATDKRDSFVRLPGVGGDAPH